MSEHAADWDRLEKDVVSTIRMLRASLGAFGPGLLRDAYYRDVVLPNLRLLARFCACVEVRP